MDEVRYMISDAAKLVEVEDHVLRYWEKMLELPISRNEMDQRFYKESDIELFKKIKHLKEKGFQLKAIKMILTNLNSQDSIDKDLIPEDLSDEKLLEAGNVDKLEAYNETESESEDNNDRTSLVAEESTNEANSQQDTKMNQFRAIMSDIIISALRENSSVLTEEISNNVSENVIREMNYLMRLLEEKEEERFRKFDAALREYQKSRMMAAASTEKKKKSKFMKKNKIYI